MTEKKRVLVVENEMLIATHLKNRLEQAGWEVVGPAGSFQKGLELARLADFAVALLDIHLGQKSSSLEIAEMLARNAVPFIFISGYDEIALPASLAGAPILGKPVDVQHLLDKMEQLSCTGVSS